VVLVFYHVHNHKDNHRTTDAHDRRDPVFRVSVSTLGKKEEEEARREREEEKR
jgi:hypothetical protein